MCVCVCVCGQMEVESGVFEFESGKSVGGARF